MKYSELPEYFKRAIVGEVTEHEDGSISVDGHVDWSGHRLTRLPIRFKEVTGKFNCGYNNLTSLADAPRVVGVYFNCANNNLTSLIGAPKSVGGDFYCYRNQITSLKGAPLIVGGGFWCQANKLTSLNGLGEVKGEILCQDNPVPTEQLIADYQRKRAKKDLALESMAIERILV